MTHNLLEVQALWKRLCKRPEKALHYAMEDLVTDLLMAPKRRRLRSGEFWALRDINLTVAPGEVVGVIGQNGAGKSTLIKIISGIIRPTHGTIRLSTNNIALIDSDGGLNPLQTGRENATAQLVMHGFLKESFTGELLQIQAFADIGEFFDAPVGTYSLGMRLRLAFAVYSRLKPDMFIIDEALGGGDEHFRNRFRNYLRTYIEDGGALLLCSHEMFAIQAFCERCIVLNQGKLIMEGPTVEAISKHHQLCHERESTNVVQSELTKISGSSDDPALACSILSVSVCSSKPGKTITPGSSVVITVEVNVEYDINNVSCCIEVGYAEHMAIATITGGYPDGAFSLHAPRSTIRCCIDYLPLVPGNYDVRIALIQPSAAVVLAHLGYEDMPVPLEVSTAINEVANLSRDRANFVYISPEWHLS